MSADTLRRAAALMRERASGLADEGPWRTDRVFWKIGSTRGVPDGWWRSVDDEAGTVALISEQDDDEGNDARRRAEHIAGMDPAVALAVADWLDAQADLVDVEDQLIARGDVVLMSATSRALAVGRAYLGES